MVIVPSRSILNEEFRRAINLIASAIEVPENSMADLPEVICYLLIKEYQQLILLPKMENTVIFHLAIPINNVSKAKAFYCEGLGCQIGRENDKALILSFYGHQVVAHVTDEPLTPQKGIYPRHFGLIFTDEADWEKLLNRATEKALSFYIEPKLRFSGQLTEHRSFFLEDPFHNLLEFKFYRHAEAIFGGRELTAIGDRT